MSKMTARILLAALVGPLAACAGEKPAPVGVAPPTRIPAVETASPGPAGVSVATATLPRDVRRAVVADAAKRFNVSANSVVLTRAEQVTWPDGSIGCPEPGMMYTQSLVPGFRLAAKTTGGELVYNTDSLGNVKSCGAGFAALKPHDDVNDPSTPRTEPPRTLTPDR